MSEARRREAIVRMATDPAFAERLRTDPQGAAGEFGLDDDDLAVLGALGEDAGGDSAVKLGQRLSKSSLFFGGAAHALEHQTGEHGTQSELGLLKCDGRAGLLKCNGETGLQCNLVVPSHEGAGVLGCNSIAGVLKCNGIVVHPLGGDGGPAADGGDAGVLLCNGIRVHPSGGDGGPAADGGDGGDGLRPIVVPPGGIAADGDQQGDGGDAGVLLCNGIRVHPSGGDGGPAADGGDGGDGLRPIVVPPGGIAADGDQQGDGGDAGVLLCNGIRVHPSGGDGGPAADGGDGGDGLRPIVVPPGGVSEIDELGTKE